MLERRVVPGEVDVPGEGVAADQAPPPLGRVGDRVPPDLLRRDDPPRAVAGARGRDDAVEGAREGVHEPHPGRGGEERRHAGGVYSEEGPPVRDGRESGSGRSGLGAGR